MSATHIHVDGIVLIVSLLFVSLFVLLGSSVYLLYGNIGFNLMTHVTERLDEEGFQFSVVFDGRDGLISGTVKNEATKKDVISIAESVEGVRIIKNELTIFSAQESNGSDSNDDLPLLPIAVVETALKGRTANEVVVSPILKLASADFNSKVISPMEDKSSDSDKLTEMTGKVILDKFVIHFKSDETQLSSVDKISLNLFSTKLIRNPLFFIEISTFHLKPSVAVKRAEIIRDFFVENGINKEHFSILWHDSGDENQVQIKSFLDK
jgi:hypothetical protein